MKRELDHTEGLGGIISMDHAYLPALKEIVPDFRINSEITRSSKEAREITGGLMQLLIDVDKVVTAAEESDISKELLANYIELNEQIGAFMTLSSARKSTLEYDGVTEAPSSISVSNKDLDSRNLVRNKKQDRDTHSYSTDLLDIAKIEKRLNDVIKGIIAVGDTLDESTKEALSGKEGKFVQFSDKVRLHDGTERSIPAITQKLIDTLTVPEKYRAQFERTDFREMGEGTISTQQLDILKKENVISPVLDTLKEIRTDLSDNDTKRAYNAAKTSLIAIKSLAEMKKTDWEPVLDENNALKLFKFSDDTILDGKQYNTLILEDNLAKLASAEPETFKDNQAFEKLRHIVNDTLHLKGDLEMETLNIKRSGREGQYKYQIKLDRPEPGDEQDFKQIIEDLQKIEGLDAKAAKNGKSVFISSAPEFFHDIMDEISENKSQQR